MRDIDNSQDIMDSRDIIKRLEELTEEHNDLTEAVSDALEAVNNVKNTEGPTDLDDLDSATDEHETAVKALTDWEDDYLEDWQNLESFAMELEGYGDWEHGETLIRDSYFTEYAEELAKDVCEMSDADCWPFTHIDWEAAADALKMDYTTGTFDGVEYWMRA